ncbi:MAG: tRNA (5-methylaminomethyl-2-thiouridine)(34)-methyltransferase MnmD [Cryomorphaceae bacterium]
MEKDPLKPTIIESGDGSHTLRVDSLNEHYHSHKGAVQESEYVFLKMGFESLKVKANITLLEVGFGTGLNALLTALKAQRNQVHYITLETYPLPVDITSRLNYVERIHGEGVNRLFQDMHASAWEQKIQITEGFTLEKRRCSLQAVEALPPIDIVYYDAFAPHAQPELWEPAIWAKLHACMASGGILVTYCAKGQVRRDMQAAGFLVERLEGPPGKREMLRATKP